MARTADPNKKNQILNAATVVFARNGYAGTLMAEVARTAGIGKGTIYEYFKSKDDLFFGVFEQIMAEAGDQVAATADDCDSSAADRLQTLASDLIQAWLDKLDLYALVMEFWSATTTLPCRKRFKAAFKAGYADFRHLVGALIQGGVDKGEFIPGIDPQAIASALIGSWDALLLQAWLDPDFDPLTASREHMGIVLKGMRANP